MPTEKNFRHGHRERVRARFLREGLSAFADYEVLELLLFYAIPRRDTKEQAHALDDTLGSLYHTLTASDTELCRVQGIGARTATFLRSILPFLEYVATEEPHKDTCYDAKSLAERIYPYLEKKSKESSLIAFLNNCDEVICINQLESGNSLSCITGDKLINLALAYRASSLVIADYRGGGPLFPNALALEGIYHLKDALSSVGVYIRDYLLFSGSQYSSFCFASNEISFQETSPFFIDSHIANEPPLLVESAEHLAKILSFATGEEKASRIAERLLRKYGTLASLLAIPYETLQKDNAEESMEILYLKILFEVRSRACISQILAERKQYSTAKEVGEMFSRTIGLNSEEHIALAMFDKEMRLIDFAICAKGSVNTASFVTRNLVEIACSRAPAYVALAHNHPSGSPFPSSVDSAMTVEILSAFHRASIGFVDHFVVTSRGHACVSRCGMENYTDMPKSFFTDS